MNRIATSAPKGFRRAGKPLHEFASTRLEDTQERMADARHAHGKVGPRNPGTGENPAAFAVTWLTAPAAPTWSLLLQPAQASAAGSHGVEIAKGTTAGRQAQPVADRFIRLMADTRELQLQHPAITFDVDPHASVVGDAGYRIVVGRRDIQAIARTPRGTFYGSATLWQLLTPPGWTRGSTAEVAGIKQQIDRMSLAGVRHVALTVGRMAWRFGGAARDAVVRPRTRAAGEFDIHADTCTEPLFATLPLAPAARAKGQTCLSANVSAWKGDGVRNLCIFATGDPRDGQWALARMAFSK